MKFQVWRCLRGNSSARTFVGSRKTLAGAKALASKQDGFGTYGRIEEAS